MKMRGIVGNLSITDWVYPLSYPYVSVLGDVNGDGLVDIMIIDTSGIGHRQPPKLFFGGSPAGWPPFFSRRQIAAAEVIFI
jgi:hypothetical protein